MAQYHLSPNGPRQCRASVQQCPYGAAGEDHYSTQAEAQEAYETKMAQAFGALAIVKHSMSEKTRQKRYQSQDALLEKVKTVQALPAMEEIAVAMTYVKNSARQANRNAKAWSEARATRRAERVAYIESRLADYEMKTSRVMAQLAHRTGVATPETAANFRALQRLQTEGANTDRISSRPAFELRPGMRLADGSKVSEVFDHGATVAILSRTPNGVMQFNSVAATDGIAYYKAGHRAAARRPRKKFSETIFAQRVREATEVQKQVWTTLRGAQEVAAHRREVAARPRMSGAHRRSRELKPLAPGLRKAVSEASADQKAAAKFLRTSARQHRTQTGIERLTASRLS